LDSLELFNPLKPVELLISVASYLTHCKIMVLVILILSLAVTLFLGDESRLLPWLVIIPLLTTVVKNIHRKRTVFDPDLFFPAYYCFWMGGGYLVSFYRRDAIGLAHPGFSHLAFLILFAFLFWWIGYHLPRLKFFPSPEHPPATVGPVADNGYNRVMRSCLIILIIGLAGTAIFYLGGALRILLGGFIEETRVEMIFGRGYLFFLAKSINTVVPIYVGTKWYFGKKLDIADYWLLAVSLVLIALPFNRRPILWFIITLLILFHYLKQNISYKKSVIYFLLFLFAAVMMFQIRSPDRSFSDRFINEIIVHVGNIGLYLQNLELIGKQGLTPFVMNLKMLLPGHQIDFGLWLKERLGMTFPGGGISLTLVGEGMITARVAGVALEAFLIGYILKLAYLKFSRCFTLRNLFIYIIILYKAAEAINYGLALLMIGTLYEIGLVLIIVPSSVFHRGPESTGSNSKTG